MINLNNLRWLFHFRIDSSESSKKSNVNLYGIGHAMRCISLSKIAEQKLGIESIFITLRNTIYNSKLYRQKGLWSEPNSISVKKL